MKHLTWKGQAAVLVLEVQQQLGGGAVRTVAMGTTDGLPRGVDAVATGGPIMVPVGPVTLGRIFDVVGEAIDGRETPRLIPIIPFIGKRRLFRIKAPKRKPLKQA
jgi:F-type H+/Na+-transporting ATPase subunit beta